MRLQYGEIHTKRPPGALQQFVAGTLPAAAQERWDTWMKVPRDVFLHLIKAMIATAAEISRRPGHWYCDQLNNHDATQGYLPLGEEIWHQTQGEVDAFVHSVGTAASIRGVAAALKRHKPDVRIVAVEPGESPVLSGGQPGPHKIEGVRYHGACGCKPSGNCAIQRLGLSGGKPASDYVCS